MLVGTHAYRHLPDLPAVDRNVRRLAALLADPEVGGLPRGHVTTVVQPESADDVLEALSEAAREASDLLLVYFAGHGLVSPVDEGLDLALAATKQEQTFRRLRYEDVRAVLRDARHVRAKAVLLDCCFAGRALVGAMGPAVPGQELAGLSRIEGTYLLAAASATKTALAPPGAEYTAFSGELIALLEDGVAEGAAYLDLAVVHDCLQARLRERGYPVPQQRNDGDGSRIVLARNRWEAATSAAGKELSDELRALLGAQQRAATDFPYKLYGAPLSALATVYVRQQTRMAGAEQADRAREFRGPKSTILNAVLGERGRAALGTRSHAILDEDDRQSPWAPHPPRDERDAGPDPAAQFPLRAVDDALALHRHLLVLGGPGQGKSTLSLQIAASRAREFAAGKSVELPLRVTALRLAECTGPWEDRIERAIREELEPYLDVALPDGVLARVPEGTRRLLMIDGLDEITDPDKRRAVIAMLGSRLQDPAFPYRLLITSRPLPQDELAFLNTLALGVYTLEPFDRGQLREFATRWFAADSAHREPDGESGALAEAFLRQVERSGMRELSRVPLLATIAAIVFRQDTSAQLPTNRFRLYETYFAYLSRDRNDRVQRQTGEVLEELRKHPNPAHLDSARLLHARRGELIAHLAMVVVGDREEGAGQADPRDLMSHALDWLDTQGCMTTRLQLPQWPTLVANALDASGLFVLEGRRLRFIHYSFPEHISADVSARAMPEVFDPADPGWLRLVHAARESTLQAWAVLVHHSFHHKSGDALLDWLYGGDSRHQDLAGVLLAEGISAGTRQVLRFVDHALWLLAPGTSPRQRAQGLRAISGLMHSPAMRTAIAGYLEMQYGSAAVRIELAEAIGPDAPDIAARAFLAIVADEDHSGTDRATAGEALARLDGVHCAAVVETLAGIVHDESQHRRDRVAAALRLYRLDGSAEAEVSAVLLETAADGELPAKVRQSAAEALAEIPGHVGTAAHILCQLVESDTANPDEVGETARLLAARFPEHSPVAAQALHRMFERAPQWVRSDIVRALMRMGGRYAPEAAGLARRLLHDENVWTVTRLSSAEHLAELGEAPSLADSDALASMIKSRTLDVGSRSEAVLAAVRLGTLTHTHATTLIMDLIADPDTGAQGAALCAVSLAAIGGGQATAASQALRDYLEAPGLRAQDRMVLWTALGKTDPSHTQRAATELRALAPLLDPYEQHQTARALVALGSRNAEAAVSLLRALRDCTAARWVDRGEAALTLAAVDPRLADEAASWLCAVTERSDIRAAFRLGMLLGAADLAPHRRSHIDAAVAALVDELTELGHPLALAVSYLADRHSPHAGEARRQLVAVYDDPDHVDNSQYRNIASELTSWGGEFTERVLREALLAMQSAESPPARRVLMARWLGRTSRAHTPMAVAIAKEVLNDVHARFSERSFAAQEIPHLSPESAIEAGEVLGAVGRDEDTPVSAVLDAVLVLNGLGPAFEDEARQLTEAMLQAGCVPMAQYAYLTRVLKPAGGPGIAAVAEVLRSHVARPHVRAADRIEAAVMLAGLSPRYRTEGTALVRRVAADPSAGPKARLAAAAFLESTLDEHGAEVLRIVRETLVDPCTTAHERIELAASVCGSELQDEHAAEVLGGYLQDDDPSVRMLAATQLARLRFPAAVAPESVLRAIVADTDVGVPLRLAAAQALAHVRGLHRRDAIAAIRDFIDADMSVDDRILVAGALPGLSGALEAEATERLSAITADPDTSPRSRVSAAARLLLLTPRGRTVAIAALRDVMETDHATRHARRRAAGVLGHAATAYSREAADYLLALAESSPPGTFGRRATLRAAALLGPRAARAALPQLELPAKPRST